MEVKMAIKFKDRLFGLMFKSKVEHAICFPNCKSVHTFFMRFPIDILMTDKNHKIVNFYRNVKPWKLILPKRYVYYTYEFPVDYLTNIKINNYYKPKKFTSQ